MILFMSKTISRNKKSAGFSLIELAIIMTIVGLFVATAAQTYRLYQQETARGTNFDRKKTIEVALGRFMALNGRLPCPADPSLPIGHPDGGRENCRPNNVAYPTLACNATGSHCRVEGARSFVFPAPGTTVQGTIPANSGPDRVLRGGVPYLSLGLAPRDGYDAWGSMFTYAVTEMLSSSYFLSQGNTTNNCQEVCGQVGENGTLALNAGSGRVFTDVLYASYGTSTGACPSFAQGACHAANSTTIIRAQFHLKNSHSYAATNGNFGDPCSGTLKNLAVVLRACEATASISFNEANGVIDHRQWNSTTSQDESRRNPNVTDGGGNPALRSWMMAIVSHGPDRKGGWNAQGQQPIACTGQGRDVINCTMNSAVFVDPTFRSFTPGPTFYDDAFVSATPIRESDKWHFSTIDAIRNKEGTSVGIGTDSPGAALDVNGAVRMLDGQMVDYCDHDGANCFTARTIGGTGIRCSGGWMKGIYNNGPNCETKVETSAIINGVGNCAGGSFLVGFCPDGTRLCKTPGGADPVCP